MEVSGNPESKILATPGRDVSRKPSVKVPSAEPSGFRRTPRRGKEIFWHPDFHNQSPGTGRVKASVPGNNERLDAVQNEVTSFLDKTIKSCAEWVFKRTIDIVAPGVGAMISTCENIIKIVNAIKVAATGEGKIDVPIPLASFGGFEFMIDVQVGGDLPVSAFITPSSEDSLLDRIEVTPESDHRRAAAIHVNLSRVLDQPELSDHAGLIRSYTEQKVLPQLSRQYEGEFELVYVYDPDMGIGAWMRISNARTQWCILIWRSRQLTPHPTGPGRVERKGSGTRRRRVRQMGQAGQGSGTGQSSGTRRRRVRQMGQAGQGSGTGQSSGTRRRRVRQMGQAGQGSGTGQSSGTRRRRVRQMGQAGRTAKPA